MNTYFPGISKVAYEGPKSTNPLAFRYYNPEEVVAGKTMREQLKFALSYWHTLCGDGTDMFGRGTFRRERSHGRLPRQGLRGLRADG